MNKLDNNVLEMLDSLDNQDEDTGQKFYRKMKGYCATATQQVRTAYGEKGLVFSLLSPCSLPLEGGGSQDFIGMEELKFVKFMPTYKGEIVFVCKNEEIEKAILLSAEWAENLFGKRGKDFVNWVSNNTELFSAKSRVLAKQAIEVQSNDYQDRDDYGAW